MKSKQEISSAHLMKQVQSLAKENEEVNIRLSLLEAKCDLINRLFKGISSAFIGDDLEKGPEKCVDKKPVKKMVLRRGAYKKKINK
jgi:hypothetical protein